MNAPFRPRDVVVRQALCRSHRLDRESLRQTLEHAEVPTGLPPTAILLVRHAELAFGDEASSVLDLREIAGRAGRPADEPEHACRAAVVFADAADVVECIAVHLRGTPTRIPWWLALLVGHAHRSVAGAATVALLRFAWATPAAAARSPDRVAGGLATLPSASVDALVAEVARAHSAESLGRAWAGATSAETVGTSERDGTDVIGATGVQRAHPPRPGAAWSSAPRGDTTDRVIARAVVATEALAMLHRSPVIARSPAFGERIERALGIAVIEPPTPRLRRDVHIGSPAPVEPARTVAARPDRLWTDPDGPGPRADGVAEPASHASEPFRTTDRVAIEGPAAARAATVVATRLGGLFYLWPLIDELGLPASAAGEGEPGPRLSAWHLLAGLAAAFDPDDPIGAVLAAQADPEPAPDPSWTYRLPHSSLDWFGTSRAIDADAVADRHDGRRVLLDLATGLVVADLPDGGAVDPVTTGHDRRRWFGHLAALLTWRLRQLGVPTAAVRVGAEVLIGDTAVHVSIALDDIDLDVRRAGLDRDPGWVPALGRHVDLEFG